MNKCIAVQGEVRGVGQRATLLSPGSLHKVLDPFPASLQIGTTSSGRVTPGHCCLTRWQRPCFSSQLFSLSRSMFSPILVCIPLYTVSATVTETFGKIRLLEFQRNLTFDFSFYSFWKANSRQSTWNGLDCRKQTSGVKSAGCCLNSSVSTGMRMWI